MRSSICNKFLIIINAVVICYLVPNFNLCRLPNMNNNKCVNCTTELKGDYCHACGERVVSPKDFTLVKLAEQTVDVFTHLDSKLYGSVKALLFKPGYLSVAYVEGIRKPFMKPFQIFVLTNILFFLSLYNDGVFKKPSYWWFETTDMGYNIKSIAERKAKESSKTLQEVAVLYDQKSSSVAKVCLVILIPLLGLIYSILFFKKKMQIGKHFIFAIHCFSFMLILMVVVGNLLNLLSFTRTNIPFVSLFALVSTIYMIFSIRRFYSATWSYSIVSAMLGFFAFTFCMDMYRSLISLYSLNSIH